MYFRKKREFRNSHPLHPIHRGIVTVTETRVRAGVTVKANLRLGDCDREGPENLLLPCARVFPRSSGAGETRLGGGGEASSTHPPESSTVWEVMIKFEKRSLAEGV